MPTIADEIAMTIHRPLTNAELEVLHVAVLKHKREMSTRATAFMFGVTVATVCRYVSTGRLRRSRHGHISRCSIDALLLQMAPAEKDEPNEQNDFPQKRRGCFVKCSKHNTPVTPTL